MCLHLPSLLPAGPPPYAGNILPFAAHLLHGRICLLRAPKTIHYISTHVGKSVIHLLMIFNIFFQTTQCSQRKPPTSKEKLWVVQYPFSLSMLKAYAAITQIVFPEHFILFSSKL